MVLSGFTGLATCGLMQLLVDADKDEKNELWEPKEFSQKFKENISDKYNKESIEKGEPFSALVEFKYKRSNEIIGDDRLLYKIGNISIKE